MRDALVSATRARPTAPPAVVDVPDERRLLNQSKMLKRRNLLTRLFTWLTFRKVTFDDRHVRTIRDLHRDGDVAFVMNQRSTLDALYLNWAFLRLGLPLAWVTDRVSWTRFMPLWRMVVYGLRRLFRYYRQRLPTGELLAYGLSRHRPALLFLKSNSWWPLGHGREQRQRAAAHGPARSARPHRPRRAAGGRPPTPGHPRGSRSSSSGTHTPTAIGAAPGRRPSATRSPRGVSASS